MRFTTEKHPNLKVKFGRGPLVEFQRGVAEVDGEKALRLAAFADRLPDYGITYDEADLPEPEEDEEPEGTPATDEDFDALTDDEVLDAYVTTFGDDDVPEDREAAVAALKALDA